MIVVCGQMRHHQDLQKCHQHMLMKIQMKISVVLQVLQIYAIANASIHEGITNVHTIHSIHSALLSPKCIYYEIHHNKHSHVSHEKCYKIDFKNKLGINVLKY